MPDQLFDPNARWEPVGRLNGYQSSGAVPAPGQIIGWKADRRAHRVVSVTEIHQANWDEATRRRWEVMGSPPWQQWDGRERAVVLLPARPELGAPPKPTHWGLIPWVHQELWWPLYDPWPECTGCGRLWPCPCKEEQDAADSAMRRLTALESVLPGCCWGCGKPITGRHNSIVFDGENLLLPGGPPPAFHTAGSQRHETTGSKCRSQAIDYEKQWLGAGPGRLARMTCPGTLFRHYESYECDSGETCPGPGASHHRNVHCTTGFSVTVPGGPSLPIRPHTNCGGKGCRGGNP